MSGDIWHGDFTSKYIEDITTKTGCYKKFAVFTKMILSALKLQGEGAQNSSAYSNQQSG